ATVQGMTRDDMVGHLETWYRPQNMVLSVAGNVTHEQVVEQAGRVWEAQEARALPEVPKAQATMSDERLRFDERDIAQANLAIGLRSLPRIDPDRYAL